ncbi:Serine/threonine-protein kinase [Conoideocrella luteorostrata]|uniref:non-specific serine/threonine protein kinase n=1 Tax=Conoideocrella luteorostrata TaxID=1105319 RepID=A0AAJ0G1S9_9HYPO|nr:Serine/threonine-protein kinase [Conoideocrella luteorostrata]
MQGVDASSTRTAADEDGTDHIGLDTPRSGVATPQPDLHDKRLPGIMSYFSQVRQDPSAIDPSACSSAVPVSASCTSDQQSDLPIRSTSSSSSKKRPQSLTQNSPRCNRRISDCRLPARVEKLDIAAGHSPSAQVATHSYPTPPSSQPSHSETSSCKGASLEAREAVKSGLDIQATHGKRDRDASQAPRVYTQKETAVAEHASRATSQFPLSSTSSVSSSCRPPSLPTTSAPSKWFSLEGLKELTRGVIFKSGPPTPTRALSAAHSSQSDGRDTPGRTSNDGAEPASGVQTPRTAGVQPPAPKGKLTIKIIEARGLRRCRDPYVVAVFQRSELISGGPRPIEEEETLSATPSGLGGIAIQRQGSDSGRPPMAIPMRSRQSSNTSIHDYNTFRNRTGRSPLTNPKWDAEAAFDVIDIDMLVDISVYDHTATGEEFLGHVDFQARKDSDGVVRGWFTLRGHADTVAENAPTGEIYVEAFYQRSEKKHFGPSDFEILKLIGKGTFGQVYQVRKRDTLRIYAMKVLQKKVIVQKKEVAHTVGERNILVRTATSDSPFIVGLKFSFQTPSELYLVTDYMSGGELFWHLQKEGRFDERRAKFYIAELILAIQHLHNNDIVYRDLKPENILLDANGHIALCDFGLSKANLTKNDTTNTFCGTTEYLAPEVLLDESGYTKMVDFWSLGVLVFEMCCGWSPFYAEDTQQMYKNIAFGKVRFPRDTLSQEGRNFVKGLLNRNPKHRLGATDDAEELKRHPFFGDIDWDLLTKKLITPPFKPKLKSETDVSYFDPEFTTALEQNGSLNERAAALARGYAASTPLSPSVQANFQGFTFVDESALDDHMRDRFRNDDEDMDDAHANHDEDDWDNIDDIDPRKANRMSGIVKTLSADEHMVGGAHFDV